MSSRRARPARREVRPVAASVAIVGRGRLGSGLFRALRAAGASVVLTAGRAPVARALEGARVWVIAVPDPLVSNVAARLVPSRVGRAGAVVLHTSASLSLAALEPLRARGAAVGVLHPLVSFASARRPPSLVGTTFVLGGASPAVTAGRALARRLGARAVVRAVHGPRYHALAALLANGAAALAGTAERELVRQGLSPTEARHAVGALLGSVAENVSALGMPGALTGPIARGDSDAVRAQRAALGRSAPGELYAALAPAILAEAVRAGLRPGAARRVRAALAAPR